jgi:hypothetical protein
LVKRLPGGAFTNNDRAAAAAAGAFRRLPVPLAADQDEARTEHRFRAISRYQHAVNHSRGDVGARTRPEGDGADAARPTGDRGDRPGPTGGDCDGPGPRPTEGSR